MNPLPKISVITIAFNDREGLRLTMKSVLEQTYPKIEYIVIDGGSTDGSKDLIQQHANSLTYWTSEPDQGIYDAINKGIKHCHGDWVIIMNSGDEFAASNVVSSIFTREIALKNQFIYGDCFVKYAGYQIFKRSGSIDAPWTGPQFSHQSIFIRGDYQRQHHYTLNNRIGADFEFFFSAYYAGLRFQRVRIPISRISSGGLSDQSRIESLIARYRVVRQLTPNIKIHLYFLNIIAIENIKIFVKRRIPEQWVHSYRRNKGTRV